MMPYSKGLSKNAKKKNKEKLKFSRRKLRRPQRTYSVLMMLSRKKKMEITKVNVKMMKAETKKNKELMN